MERDSLYRIEQSNYVFGALIVFIASLTSSWEMVFGVFVGVALTCANFTYLRKLTHKLLNTAPDRRGGIMLLILPKMLGLLIVASLALYFLDISPIGVGVGFSVFLISITIEAIRFGRVNRDPS